MPDDLIDLVKARAARLPEHEVIPANMRLLLVPRPVCPGPTMVMTAQCLVLPTPTRSS